MYMTYSLRLSVKCAPYTFMKHDENSMHLSLTGLDRPVTVSPIGAEKLSEASRFVFSIKNFETQKDAYSLGISIKDMLRVSSVKTGFLIEVGKEEASGASNYLKDKVKKELGINLLSDVHGIDIYEDKGNTRVLTVSTDLLITQKSQYDFSTLWSELINMGIKLSEKQRLTCDLYISTGFESSIRAKFITLITALEVLAKPKRLGDKSLELIDSFTNCIADERKYSTSKDTEAELGTLASRLSNLKKESIRSALRSMTAKHMSEYEYSEKSSDEFVRDMYDLRSELVHKGYVSQEQITDNYTELRKFVKDILLLDIGLEPDGTSRHQGPHPIDKKIIS